MQNFKVIYKDRYGRIRTSLIVTARSRKEAKRDFKIRAGKIPSSFNGEHRLNAVKPINCIPA